MTARRTKFKLAVALVVATLATVGAARPVWPVSDDSAKGDAASLEKLIGPTDGYDIAIEASGDLMGSLETCGCPKRPMGGFAWRSGYSAELARATGGAVPIVHVDAGRSFADDLTPEGMADDVRIKNEWMLRSFDALDTAAVNVAHRDLVYLGRMLATKDYRARAKRFPALDRLVSANVVATSRSVRPLQPYAVRTVRGKRLGSRPVRIGILGVTEAAPASVAKQLEHEAAGYRITDPIEAVRTRLPELRAKADYVVVLAYVDRNTAKQIAALVEGPGVVVAAHQFPLFGKTEAGGATPVAYVPTQTKWLAELRLARHAPTSRALEIVAHRDVPLDADTPSDPAAQRIVDSARAEFTRVQQMALDSAGNDADLARLRESLAEESGFVGAETCATCHLAETEIWKSSRHSHAFRTLEEHNRHLDPACTVCHSVRQGEPGGFLDARRTPRLQDVQCEACHGPGREHARQPGPGYGAVTVPTACERCHTHENDPDFDFPTYWPKIAHGE